MDLKKIIDNKKFWATVNSLFNEIDSSECIYIEENGKVISNDKEIARIFDKFFVKIVPNLGINTNHDFLINAEYQKHSQLNYLHRLLILLFLFNMFQRKMLLE